jgi:hypothetical protein
VILASSALVALATLMLAQVFKQVHGRLKERRLARHVALASLVHRCELVVHPLGRHSLVVIMELKSSMRIKCTQ